MADTKTTALTELTAPISTDIIPIVDDPGGSPETKKITLANLFSITGRVLISEQTPTGTGTVTFNSIPGTYKKLEIELIARGTTNATEAVVYIYFNNDTTASNYRYIQEGIFTSASEQYAGGDATNTINISAATAPSGDCGCGLFSIVNYAGTTLNKCVLYHGTWRSATGTTVIRTGSVFWESAAAITRVDLVLSAGNYDTGSTLRLYGVY